MRGRSGKNAFANGVTWQVRYLRYGSMILTVGIEGSGEVKGRVIWKINLAAFRDPNYGSLEVLKGVTEKKTGMSEESVPRNSGP